MSWGKYGSKKNEKPVHNGITFDSEEEVEFYHWLEEALRHGIISEFKFHNDVFKLMENQRVVCDKSMRKQGFLTLQDVEYQLDFKMIATDKFFEMTKKLVPASDGWIYIDTKSEYTGNDSVFSIKQKLMYQQHGLYVNRVVPLTFFKETWRPERAGLTKIKRDVQKKYQGIKTFKELGL